MMFRDMIGWDIAIACAISLISIYCGIDAKPAVMLYWLGVFHVIALNKTWI